MIPESKDAEAAYLRVKPEIDKVPEDGLELLNVDIDKVGKVAYELAQQCVSGDVWPHLEDLPVNQYDAAATVSLLADLALAASWIATRGLTVRASESDAQLPQSLVQEATRVRQRMLATCEYCLDDVAALTELASIRSGIGYDDTKHDLRRLALLYRDRKADLAGRKYDATDEAKALALANDINVRQRGSDSGEQVKLERRTWTLLKRIGERTYAAAHFVTDHAASVQKALKSIHTWRERGTSSAAALVPNTVAPIVPPTT